MLLHTGWGLKPNFANTVGAGYSLQTGVGTRNGVLKNVVKISIFREKKCLFVIFFAYRNTNKVVSTFSRSPTHVSNNVHKISYACRSNYYRIRQCTQKGAHYMYIKLVCSLTKEITAKFSFKIK